MFSKIDEEKFAVLYSNKFSRPNFPVNILISLEILQHLFNLTDEQLIDNFHFNLQFLYALGLQEVGELSLVIRIRNRLRSVMAVTKEDLIVETFNDLLMNFFEKLETDTTIQRMDSTMIQSNMKNLSRIELILKVISYLLMSRKSFQRIYLNWLIKKKQSTLLKK